MGPLELADLLRVDAAVAAAVRAHEAALVALARAEAPGTVADPFAGPHRAIAGQTAYRALTELAPSVHEVPLRDALLAWVAELVMARVAFPAEVARAEAFALREPTFAAPARPMALGGASPEPSAAGGPRATSPASSTPYAAPVGASARDALGGILAAPSAAGAAPWLELAAQRGADVAAGARRRDETRTEVARRLGLEGPDATTPAPPRALLARGARALLDATDDVAAMALGEARARELEGGARSEADPTAAVRAMLARGAHDGWPARLSLRWLASVFAPELTAAARLRGLPLPVPLGATSFARALSAYGGAGADGTRAGLPFALARAPRSVRARRFALACASLPATPVFHRRVLGVSAGAARDQARHVARAALLSARVDAARVLLGDPAAAPDRAAYEELGARVFGAPLPPGLRGALPAARVDEASRAAAWLTVVPFVDGLVARFDEDWFRNPRAAAHLRALLAAPEATDPHAPRPLDPEAAAGALARAFELAAA